MELVVHLRVAHAPRTERKALATRGMPTHAPRTERKALGIVRSVADEVRVAGRLPVLADDQALALALPNVEVEAPGVEPQFRFTTKRHEPATLAGAFGVLIRARS